MHQVSKWQARSLLNRVHSSQYGFDVTVNPYRGCAHACHYCYARDTHRYLNLDIAEDFSQKLFVKERSSAQIAEEVRRLPLDHVIALGTATDPYQPLEGHHQLSRRLLQIVSRSGHPITITTKSPLILRDLDILKVLAAHHQIRVHISLISMDRDLLKVVEPGAPSPAVRIRTVADLARHHIPTVVFAAPVLPYLTDRNDQLAVLFGEAKRAGAEALMADRLRLSPTMKSYFFDWLCIHYPDLLASYQSLYPGSTQYPNFAYSQALTQRLTLLRQSYQLPQHWAPPTPWQSLMQAQFDF